jgi:DNA-binding NtrC family response regulator
LLKEKVIPADSGTIVMTAEGGVAGAVEAMRLGALDYLVKPFELGALPLVIGRARQTRQSARVDEHRRREAPEREFFFGSSLAALENQLQRIIASDNRMQERLPPVLIQGETGTGKTTVARWLHRQGPRGAQPLVEVNCPALPDTLAESELFGHERGAFTDARSARMGLFEAANGGTLFLDELPSLSLALQAKVLTSIEDRKIRRLGGTREIPVDARIIAATNRDLKQLVSEGKFRDDLFHRLDLFRLSLPPLRERGEDILKLAEALLTRLNQRHRLPRKTISEQGKHRLLSYPWPGNVRELAHELERALVFSDSDSLDFEQLQGGADASARARTDDWFNPAFTFPAEGFSLEVAINRLIQRALGQTGHNVSAAARLLGVSRDYLRYRLAEKQVEKNGN